MKAATREFAKQVIIDSNIKRFTQEETLNILHQKGIKISLCTLKKINSTIKEDAREWVTTLAKNRNDYIALYKQSIDTYRLLQHESFKVLYDDKSSNFVKLQAALAIGKFQENITQLHDAMPVVMAIKDRLGITDETTGDIQQ